MKPTHIEHIGIAVKNLSEAIPLYETLLGTKFYAVEEVADQMVRTAFFQVGQTKIELLESTVPDGPIGSFIQKRGEGIHHFAIAVENVAEALREIEGSGIQVVDREPRPGAEGLSIGFLHPRSTLGVLIELCEKP